MEKDAENTTDAPVWFAKTLLKSYSRRKKKSRKKIQEIWGIVAAIACQYREENYKITELFEGLVKLAPEVPELLVRLGISLFHDGRLGEAKDALITAIDRNAININEALDWLARTAIQSLGKQPERNFNDLQNTYNFLTEAASKHPASGGSDFLGVLGRFAYWLGKQDEAEFFLVGAMQIDPADADHGKLLAALYCDEGRVEEALRVLEQLVAYGVDDNEVKVRILELRAFLAGRNSNNPKGGTSPPTEPGAPEDGPPSNGGSKLKGPGTSLGSFDIREDEPPPIPTTLPWRSAAIFYRRRKPRGKDTTFQITHGRAVPTTGWLRPTGNTATTVWTPTAFPVP